MLALSILFLLLGATAVVAADRYRRVTTRKKLAGKLHNAAEWIIQHHYGIAASASLLMIFHFAVKVIGARDVPLVYILFWLVFWLVVPLLWLLAIRHFSKLTRDPVGQICCNVWAFLVRSSRLLSDDSFATWVMTASAVFCFYMTVLQGLPSWGPDAPAVGNLATRTVQQVWQSGPVINTWATIKLAFVGGKIPAVERAFGRAVEPQAEHEPVAKLPPRYQRTWWWFSLTPALTALAILGWFRSKSDDLAQWFETTWDKWFGKLETVVTASTGEEESSTSATAAATATAPRPVRRIPFHKRVLDDVVGGLIVKLIEIGTKLSRKVT